MRRATISKLRSGLEGGSGNIAMLISCFFEFDKPTRQSQGGQTNLD
jgi:hypothetical protein